MKKFLCKLILTSIATGFFFNTSLCFVQAASHIIKPAIENPTTPGLMMPNIWLDEETQNE